MLLDMQNEGGHCGEAMFEILYNDTGVMFIGYDSDALAAVILM